jgi:hypothetical protein
VHPEANPRCKNTPRLWAFFSPTRMDEIDFDKYQVLNPYSIYFLIFSYLYFLDWKFLRGTKISRTEIDFLSFLFVFCFPCIRASLKFLSYLGRYGRNLQDARMHAEILRIFSENLAFFSKMGTVNRCIRASWELATMRVIGIYLYASWAGFWINPPL